VRMSYLVTQLDTSIVYLVLIVLFNDAQRNVAPKSFHEKAS
jgi:hypothetical protein